VVAQGALRIIGRESSCAPEPGTPEACTSRAMRQRCCSSRAARRSAACPSPSDGSSQMAMANRGDPSPESGLITQRAWAHAALPVSRRSGTATLRRSVALRPIPGWRTPRRREHVPGQGPLVLVVVPEQVETGQLRFLDADERCEGTVARHQPLRGRVEQRQQSGGPLEQGLVICPGVEGQCRHGSEENPGGTSNNAHSTLRCHRWIGWSRAHATGWNPWPRTGCR
jgi:hypothetical protein